ncbi:MAG: hypothetical protein KG029_16930, partial [Bacteroidetes bacterium]|nr:hypothetical protein [Bacteroidota bacterium]
MRHYPRFIQSSWTTIGENLVKKVNLTFLSTVLIVCTVIISQFASPTITSAQATGFTFTTVADTYVAEDYPDTNFGTNPSLRLDNTPLMRSYLRFTVSG